MVMDTADHVPGTVINYKPAGASRVSESQISSGVVALNINQALLQNPEMLRGKKLLPLIFFTSILLSFRAPKCRGLLCRQQLSGAVHLSESTRATQKVMATGQMSLTS